ncbi:MAG: trigger factor [Roseburia sp.]
MKKKVIALLLCAMTVTAMAGCGKQGEKVDGTEAVGEESTSGTETASQAEYVSLDFDIKPDELVKLCDYSAIPVELTQEYTVDDGDVEDYFAQLFSYYGPFYVADDTKTTVEEGDIVNVDYVGKLDGVAFDNGSAENQNIDVYNNCAAGGSGFIDGFTEGLKGASVGDVLDCDVTFPENYQNTDLAGKAVVFTFTVNSIQKEIGLEDVDDAFAQENFQADTVEDMYADIRSYLESSAESSKEEEIYTALQDYLLANCTVTVPEDYLTARTYNLKQQFINSSCGGDESQLESYLSTYYGLTVEEAEAQWQEMMDENIRMELIMEAICDAEGIEADETGYQTYITSLMSNAGYDSEKTLYETYGYGDADWGKKYFEVIYRGNLAFEQLRGTAQVTVAESTEDAEAEGTEAVSETEAVE